MALNVGIRTKIAQFGGYALAGGVRMNWLALIVLAVLAVAVVIWLARRFGTEGHRIDGLLRDFDRENPRHEPGSPSQARRLAGLRRRR